MNRHQIKSIVTLASGIFCLSQTSSNAALSVLPTEYWQFDGNLNAEVDNAANAGTFITNNGGIGGFVAGMFGQAIDLESTGAANAWVSVADGDDTFDLANDIGTFSLWFQVESFDTNWQALLGGGEGNEFRIHRNNGSATELQVNLGNSPIRNFGPVTDGQWHHLAFSNDAGNGTQVWFDGNLTSSGTPRNTVGNGQPFAIGNNPDQLGRAWDGRIDDVAFWDTALTDADVQQIWNGGAGASIASLSGSAIPEPSVFALVGLAGLGMIVRRRR